MPYKTLTLLTVFTLFFAAPVFAQPQPLRVENFVRIKGQESTTIRARGIVSGLPGTGDDPKAHTPTALAMLRELSRTGLAGADAKGISSTKNNALVDVIVRIPPHGARDGDLLDCTIVSIGNAKSLAGGNLSPVPLGTSFQQDDNSPVLGMAQGRVMIEDAATPTSGRIINGCRLHADFTNPYIKDGLVTLVIKNEHAHPKLANAIAEAINEDPELQVLSIPPAKVINSNFVAVRIPPTFYNDPMDFIARIMDAEILAPPVPIPKVMINERTGTISIGENVEVKPTIVTHRNFVVDVEPALAAGEMEQFPRQFLALDSDMTFRQMNGENVRNVKLRALQATLNSLRATPQDIIDVIKILHKQGAIVGDVEFVE